MHRGPGQSKLLVTDWWQRFARRYSVLHNSTQLENMCTVKMYSTSTHFVESAPADHLANANPSSLFIPVLPSHGIALRGRV